MDKINKLTGKTLGKLASWHEQYARIHRETLSRRYPVSVLCFHNVLDENNDAYSITKERFEQVLESISSDCTDIDSAASGIHHGVVLTFDDGYQSIYETVFPMLERRGIPFVSYIPTDFIGKPGYLTREQIRELAQTSGACTIGSHMCSHRMTREMTDGEILREWDESKQTLEDIIGKKVIHAALPYGSMRACSLKSITLGLKSGYQTIATTLAIPYKRGRILPRFVYKNNQEFTPVLSEYK